MMAQVVDAHGEGGITNKVAPNLDYLARKF